MTDESGATETPDPLSQLRELREAAGREVAGLARELHIDAALLEALEHGEFERLGAPVYVKGHLKRYALAIGADPVTLIAAYDERHGGSAPPPVVAAKSQPRFQAAVPLWIWIATALGIVLLAILVAFFLTGSDPETTPVAAPAARVAESGSTPISSAVTDDGRRVERLTLPTPASGETTAPAPQSVAAEPSLALATQSVPSEPVTNTNRAGTVQLELSYRDQCWTEIRAGDGSRLFSGMANAGEVKRLSGIAPLTVVLGNRAAVDVRVDGTDFEIPAGAVRRRTARFTVPAP
ncbi:MAG: RodZ domain-containing protein [Pseudomonadota bacterium]